MSDDLIAFEVFPSTTSPEPIILVVNDALIDLPKIERPQIPLPMTEEEARLREHQRRLKSTHSASLQPLDRTEAVTQTDFSEEDSHNDPASRRSPDAPNTVQPDPQRHNTPERTRLQQSEMLPMHSDGVNFPSSTELLMFEDRGDPFAAAAGLLHRLGRFCRQVIGKQVGVVKELSAETDGYDAYLSASGPADQAHFEYARKMQQHRRDLDRCNDVLQNILIANDQMRRLMRGMVSQYEKAQKTIQELQARGAQQTLALQQEVLNSLAASVADVNPEAPPEVSQLAQLHAVSSSLELANVLSLVGDDIAQEERDRIAQRLEQMKEQLATGEKPVSQDQVGQLVRDSQVFIANLRAEASIAATHVDELPAPPDAPQEPDSPPLDRTKADLARVRRHRDELARDLKASKSREERLKAEIRRLNERLENERSLAEGEIDKYKAQLATLRQLFDTSGPADNLEAKFKQQILSMQGMMDACSSERDMFRSRAEEAEDASRQLDEQIDVLNRRIADLEADNCKPYHTESAIFKEADIAQRKEEQEASAAMIEDQRRHLETVIDENKALRERCVALDEQILQLRKDLRSSNDRVDDLAIKVAARVGVRVVRSLAYKTVQCELLVDKPPPEPIVRVIEVPVEKIVYTERPIAPAASIEPPPDTQVDESESEREEPPVSVRALLDLEISDSVAIEKMACFRAKMISAHPSICLCEAEESVPEVEDDYSEALVTASSNTARHLLMADDVATTVHRPLIWAKKKHKVLLPEASVPAKPPRVSMKRIVRPAQPPPTHPLDLTMNNALQGRRRGAPSGGRPPAPPPSIDPPPERPVPPPVVDQKALHIEGTRPHSLPTVPIVPPKPKALPLPPRQGEPIEQSLEVRPPVPIRITLVAPAEPPREVAKLPIIITQPEAATSSFVSTHSPLGVRGAALPPFDDPPELKEARLLEANLRSKLRVAQARNDELELEILQLKQKIAALLSELDRTRMDANRTKNELATSRNSWKNDAAKIEICWQGIAARDDEIAKLKRETFAHNRNNQSIAGSIWKLRGAEQARLSLEREQKRRMEMALVAERAKEKASDDAVRSHWDRMVERHKITIARLEAQRRMWSEIERNNLMAVLGSMSLLSISQYQVVREVLPDYSPFAKSRVSIIKQIMDKSREDRELGSLQVPRIQHRPERRRLRYDEKLSALDKVEPPLTDRQRKQVVRRQEPPDLEDRLERVIDAERAERTFEAGGPTSARPESLPLYMD
jgi:hypothetical protein